MERKTSFSNIQLANLNNNNNTTWWITDIAGGSDDDISTTRILMGSLLGLLLFLSIAIIVYVLCRRFYRYTPLPPMQQLKIDIELKSPPHVATLHRHPDTPRNHTVDNMEEEEEEDGVEI